MGKGSGQELQQDRAEQSCGLGTGQRWLSVTQEIKRGKSRGLPFSLGICFYTLNFLLGESKCTPQPSPGCPRGGDGLGSTRLLF